MRRLAVLPIAITLVAACAAPAPEADVSKGQIRADMKEFVMGLTATEVKAGTVTFIARNVGTTAHDLIVLKTDLAADKIPLDGQTGKAKEDGKVGSVNEVPTGQSRNLRLELPAGQYVVICNVPTHYQLGMHSPLTVK
ncbi:MAG TPA: plastocyanin/azurin family copper-binding protein [Candidatus Limnocylindria bacterium]